MRLLFCSNRIMIEPGQWPAGIAVTDIFLSESLVDSFSDSLNGAIGVVSKIDKKTIDNHVSRSTLT